MLITIVETRGCYYELNNPWFGVEDHELAYTNYPELVRDIIQSYTML